MAPTLIVPINVAALAVGLPDTQNRGQGLAPMADFSRLPWVGGGSPHNPGPYVSAVALENAQPFEGQVPLLQGIHLHWALPGGLTAGTAGGTGLAFPNAPNRWLVTRIVVSAPEGSPATTALESWVLESDLLSAAATAPAGLQQPTVPLPPGTAGQSFAYLGQAFDLAGWSEGGNTAPRLSPFTALGYGEPTFAAFYPNCSTVFGYYDALADLTDYDPAISTVSYQVAGWYSDPAADPLAQSGATPASYGWSYAGSKVPKATVCAGVAGALPWNPATAYLGQPPGPMTVAVAASTPEALSALMAAVLQQEDPGGFANVEQVLNALQFGLLSGSTSEVDSLAAFEEQVHGAGFATLAAGPLWTVQAGGGVAAAGGEVTLPGPQAAALDTLNVLQLAVNDAAFDLAALQFQLFVDWYKFQLVEHSPALVPPSLRNQASMVEDYLLAEAAAIAALETTRIPGLQAAVAAAAAGLESALGVGFTLTNATGAPRYYQPADPALVLSGPDVTPTDRYGNDGASSADGMLACRLDGDVVVGAILEPGLVTGSAEATVDASALPGLASQPAGAPAALLDALVHEAFFLAGGLQPALAAAVAAAGGVGNPALLDLAATVAALAAAAAAFLAGAVPAGVAYGGLAPDPPYLDEWNGTPWLPMLLQYEVELLPVQSLDPAGATAYPAGFIDDNFAFGADDVELRYTGAAPTKSQIYAGTAILTPSATVDLAGQVAAFLEGTGSDDPELAAVLAALSGLPVLSQGLNGMTAALLMRGLTLQMPVADPLLPAPLQQEVVAPVAAAVAGQNATAPLPENSFNPIRTGIFSILKLRLVDVFGRFRDYPSPAVQVARGLAPPAGLDLPAGQAFLPPRITQPARLLFRWRAADDGSVESNGSPATTPVLGWVVPNYLDASLALYAAAGTALGELALSADQATVLWTPAPGGAFAIGTPLATVLAGQNPSLAAFAMGIYNDGDASFLAPFFAAVREALTFSLPARFAESAAQAVLVGQPLALARASLALDLAGPAATDESWSSFAGAVLDGVPPTDGGLGQVSFPVLLGAPDRLGDTLVGYWISPTDAAGYRTFYAPYAKTNQGGVSPPAENTLTLTPQGASAGAVEVVLLLDPRGSVLATTGILPAKAIDIPREQYAQALASLAVTFETTPVLSGSTVPQAGGAAPMLMVQPKVSAGSWSWVTTDGTAWSATALTDAASAQATLDTTPQQISEGWLRLELPS